MTEPDDRYFALSLDSLRAIARWAAVCAEHALPLFEARAAGDARPREAIEGIAEFASGGKRTARLRSISLAAHAAAREVEDPAAVAAARAAGLVAAVPYTHPLADVHQTKHIVGPAAYAALALELAQDGNQAVGDAEVLRSIESAPQDAGEVLSHMPPREPGSSRLETLFYALDSGIRGRFVARPEKE